MVRDAEQSKRNILRVAERIFAQKGFDGARVDEIANEAGVNKALLYYYFKSKKQILEEIIKQFVDIFMTMAQKYAGNMEVLMDIDQIGLVFREILPFLEDKKNILRIIMAESLKSGSDEPILFKVLEQQFDHEIFSLIDEYKEMGFHIDEHVDKMRVTEFFTGLLPVINYVVYADKWARYFKVSPDDLKKWFIEAYEETHVAHHRPNKKPKR